MNGQDFTTEGLLKASGGFQMPKMAAEMRIVSSNPPNEPNKAFWQRKGSVKLVGGGKISLYDLTGPGTPHDPVWTITKPNGEKTVIRGLGEKDGKPVGDKFVATTTKPNGDTEVIRQDGTKGSRTLYSANGQVGPTPITSGKKTHPFHGNQHTAHGTEVPVKGAQPKKKSLDFTTNTLLKGF